MSETIPLVSTFKIAAVDGGARRATLADVGGAVLEDFDAPDAPNPDGTELRAAMCNQWEHQVRSASAMIHSAIITIALSGGTPSIALLKSANDELLAADFTIVDNAAGDTSIRWTTTTLPPVGPDPIATLNEDFTKPSITCVVESGLPAGTSGIRVRTRQDGTLTVMRFTVAIN